ncbi:MAG: gamma-glutamyltransferase [Flavobacteriaceae bacterium]|tara:strand:- start:26367 stop:28055 length:1689 start_codon:yes stop_codon:yes gene_type:complete
MIEIKIKTKLILFNFFILFITGCESLKKTPIQGAVVSAREEASKIGVEVLKKGGNAFDAMVATSFALTVVFPNAGNITGGGFMVYRTSNGEIGSLDYRETAPLSSSEDMYLDINGKVVGDLSRTGGLAVGVPGSVAGILEVHKKMGSLPLADLIQPSIELAENGFIVTEKQSKSLNSKRDEFKKVNGDSTFYGKSFKKGDLIKNPNLAKALNEILRYGSKGFYEGWVAESMVEKVNKTGGKMSLKDLKSYKPKWRKPIVFDYKDLKIISMGPPSSGGICLAQMMKMIEPFNIGQFKYKSHKALHLMIEAERRSYADRSYFLGDPDFVSVPKYHLISSDYLNERMLNYNPTFASESSNISHGDIVVIESDETTHFSILDSFGNAVSVTTTLNGSYGSKVFVDEIGVFMNNEMDDFSSKPGSPNMFGLIGGKSNSIEPKKRMLSSMTPTIVEKNDKLFLILGTPGGSTIITSVFQTILNAYEYEMGIQESIDSPRFHHQWVPDSIRFEPNFKNISELKKLELIGHHFDLQKSKIIGRVDAIMVDKNGNISVGADKRGDDFAETY